MGRSRQASLAPQRPQDVPTRRWTVLAQDPGVLDKQGRALTTTVEVPAERLERGPKGHRIHVVDYDASTDYFYSARTEALDTDIYANVKDITRLIRDPHFHQQNVYALTMSTLYEFERALGRPVDWGLSAPSHQLKVAPHAFQDANAYYSRESESLNFGYFPDDDGNLVYTCLSHDIVVHETAHAILDGLRCFYLNPSSSDQAGFHEGFADVVALLSVFKHHEIIEYALKPLVDDAGRVPARNLAIKPLASTALMRLAEEMGSALEGVRGTALRHSVDIKPDRRHYKSARYAEEHDRGELLVAIVFRSFLQIWIKRLQPLLVHKKSSLACSVVAEEGGTAAKQLLNVMIRALDYLPPVDMTYRDYLSALLTADYELYPDQGKYDYRGELRAEFAAFGILPASGKNANGYWEPPPKGAHSLTGMHFERLQRDPSTMFRFIWENRDMLGIFPDAFTRVISVRPVMRVSCDGAVLRETVAEYVQTLSVYSAELHSLGIEKPKGMHRSRLVKLYGGGTLIFSEYGQLKYHIGTGVVSRHQSERLQSLWDSGYFEASASPAARIAQMHNHRSLKPLREPRVEW
ncbi:MAG TPA: hypothetical protein VJM12_16645 [Pyrinomonadaceae bacterium]|nr:hypothetical protein [Pyrinomonadaceae bacterium]